MYVHDQVFNKDLYIECWEWNRQYIQFYIILMSTYFFLKNNKLTTFLKPVHVLSKPVQTCTYFRKTCT